MKLHEIRQKKAAKVAEARTLLTTAETEKRSLNTAEQTAFDAIKDEITGLEGHEARAQFVEDAERRTTGEPVDKARAALEARVSVIDAVNVTGVPAATPLVAALLDSFRLVTSGPAGVR